MKALFAHDHKIYKYNSSYYSSGGLSKKALERYTNVFNNLTVISRQIKLDNINKTLTLSSNSNTEFVEVPSFSISSFKEIYKANSIIKNKVEESDFLIARLPSFIGSIAVNHAKKLKKPYLIELVGCPWDAFWNHSYSGKMVAPLAYLSTKKQVEEASHVIYVTKQFLQKRYPTHGVYTNCSNVTLNEFESDTLTNRINKIKKSNKEKIILGTIAAVDVQYKGQQYIIKALGILKKRGITNFEYQLVGNGDTTYLNSIVKKYKLSDEVKFLGSLSHNEVFKWLDNIDIYAQPSRTEGLPRALIEAMSRGLPAIGSDAGGISELLEEEFIFSSNMDTNEIKNTILRFDKKTSLEQSLRNFNESKKYASNKLEKKREEFLKEFKNSIKF